MIEKDLNKVLNYMKQYVENKYEHDSEPMLNWKDLKLILDEIERLNNGIKELDNMFYETFRISQNGYYSISEWELKDFTNKLQELKGSYKYE